MSSNSLPKTVVVVDKIERHDKNQTRAEANESFRAAQAAAKRDPEVQKWLSEHKHLWRR